MERKIKQIVKIVRGHKREQVIEIEEEVVNERNRGRTIELEEVGKLSLGGEGHPAEPLDEY